MCLIYINPSFASYIDYLYPFRGPSFSNYGTLGLIQNPSARFLEPGSLAFSWSHNEPYLRGSIVAYPFSWLEASYQYTDVNNQPYSFNSAFSGSQSLKDKSFDAKIKLMDERLYVPAISVGFRDLGGTGMFSSEFLVFNKYFRGVDFSVGLGWGHLNGNRISNPLKSLHKSFEKREIDLGEGGKVNYSSFFSGDAGYFGGIEYLFPRSHGLRLKLEYDGTNYKTEAFEPIDQSSKINAGLLYSYSDNLQFKISYTRGRVLNFGFSYSLGLGKSKKASLVKEPRQDLPNNEVIKKVTERSDENLYKATLLYLQQNGYNVQRAKLESNKYQVVYAQTKYRDPALSSGRIIDLIDQISPPKVETISVSEINGGIGLYTATIDRETFNRYKANEQSIVLERYIKREGFRYDPDDDSFTFAPTINYPAVFNSVSPDLHSQIGGPDGFFFGDLKLRFDTELALRRNLTINSELNYSIVDNMNDLKVPSDSILPHVRTDIVSYLRATRGNLSIARLDASYYIQPKPNIFLKLQGGILESMFNGYGFEALYRDYNKNYAIGIDAWKVEQREYRQLFDTIDYSTVTGHLTYYYFEPSSRILFTVRGGKYLAKDSGFTFNASRAFKTGFRIGVYFSLTDISAFEFGEGSFDKGFYFYIPLDLFVRQYSKDMLGWGIRPVTRDGAQVLQRRFPLYGVTDKVSNQRYIDNIGTFFD